MRVAPQPGRDVVVDVGVKVLHAPTRRILRLGVLDAHALLGVDLAAMSLLTDLRNVGEQFVEAELPQAKDLVPILGALVAHLETKGEQLAEDELAKLANKLKPPEPPPPGAPPAEAAGPIATEGPAAGPSKAQLEAELAQARAQAAATPPTVLQTEPPPPA